MRASGSAVAGGAELPFVATVAFEAAAISAGPRSSLPAGPEATGGGVAAADDALAIGAAFPAATVSVVFDSVAAGGAASAATAAGGAAAAADSLAPSSAVSITAISALFGTVAPSSTRISRRIPSNGDGTSALTLSVTTSTSGSYLST
jgi:hypothetical protein